MPSIAPFLLLVNLSETNTTKTNITEDYFADDNNHLYSLNSTNTTDMNKSNVDNESYLIVGVIVFVVVFGPCICYKLVLCCADCKCCCDINRSSTSRVWEKDRKRAIKLAKKNAKKEQEIVNCKLSASFIKTANEENRQCHREHAEKCGENDCAICMTPIVFDKRKTLFHYNSDKKKNIYLKCGHNFHISCLQAWVKSKALNNESIICPLCRAVIAYNPPKETITNLRFYPVYDSDSDSIDSYDYY